MLASRVAHASAKGGRWQPGFESLRECFERRARQNPSAHIVIGGSTAPDQDFRSSQIVRNRAGVIYATLHESRPPTWYILEN